MECHAENEEPGSRNAVDSTPTSNGHNSEQDARPVSTQPTVCSVPTAKSPVGKDDMFYNMSHRNRGCALIFNHMTFLNLPPRLGTDADCERLKNCLKRLGFNVMVHQDMTYIELMDVIQKAANVDHSDSDCLVVAVLSHGGPGVLYAKDIHYKLENLSSPFTADKCITLAGKPKLFFIQACQGERMDGGIMMQTETDGGTTAATYKMSTQADFLIAHSTIPGLLSWRDTNKGSWFIQALCQELEDNGFLLDLVKILTNVNRRVAYQKQNSCFTSRLIRIAKFTPKLTNKS